MGIARLQFSSENKTHAVVYGLFDPFTTEIFYVGVTTRVLNRRLGSHIHDARRLQIAGDRCDRIRTILAMGGRPIIDQLEEVALAEWEEAEQFWIGYMRFIGAGLTNKSIGGPGALGARQDAITQARRQQAAAGRDMTMLHVPENREKAAAKMRRAVNIDGVEYAGIKAASRETGIPYSLIQYRLDLGIYQRLQRRRGSKPRKLMGRPKGEHHFASRPILVDGVRYSGVLPASRETGISAHTIRAWLRRGRAEYVQKPN